MLLSAGSRLSIHLVLMARPRVQALQALPQPLAPAHGARVSPIFVLHNRVVCGVAADAVADEHWGFCTVGKGVRDSQ